MTIAFVATGSYNTLMKPLKTVGIKELKDNLSSYLREVRGGATVLVSDRNDIVAELREPYSRMNVPGPMNPLLLEWAEARLISLPVSAKQPLETSCISSPPGTAAVLLNRNREESGE